MARWLGRTASSEGAPADLEPRSQQGADLLRQIARAAGIDTPRFQLVSAPERFGRAEVKRDGPAIYIRRELLAAPAHVLQGVLAHEVAHLARRDPQARRRLRWTTIAAIWVIAAADFVISASLVLSGHWLLWAFALIVELATFVLPRAVQLVIWRRQEYACDALAAQLLGGASTVIEFLDWMTNHTRMPPRPLPVRLWNATHPSNAARRAALLNRFSNEAGAPVR